ncbi:MAG TPA: UDP-N-acetylmuramoyl-L-alanyl-D-glutamate--2,6-diaminopimelate ligase, partial [Desulfobacterales bacterium]|nr:UDP-N-acetylmuramoyl-L-alanyl-D-glutamate--2,6-diaminopimelate ligase [Desulfobacterales bacterium]
VKVKDSREALSRLSINFYRPDFNKLTLVGITGTNGKTTTSYLMESILKEAGKEPGVIGTVNYRFKGLVKEAPVTTPESLELMEILREMNHRGITHVIMEVSSHALEQGRVEGCPFKVRVFTNISRDHLDYHGTMEAYFQAKAKLFNSKGGDGADRSVGIINVDLPEGKRLVSIIDIPWLGFGLSEYAHVRAQDIHATKDGIRFRLITPKGETEIRSSLLGTFNIYNILAASGAALALGIGLNQIQRGIEKIKLVPGRMEPVSNNRGLFIVVDYAHTPDALSKVLETLRPLVSGRIITVFGCGGDRDKGKRDLMGKVAAQGSDMVIITSDNPRTEDPMG